MTITLNELHDLTIPVAEDFNANFRALKAGQEAIEALAGSMVPTPTGAMMDFAGDTAPSGWMLCDGSAISRTTYSALFAVIGTKWGAGDGSSTFNVPDLRGRVSVGAGTGTGLTERLVGGHGGEEAHALTAGEGPPHSHTTVYSVLTNTGSGPYSVAGGTSLDFIQAVTNTAGSGVAHNTMPPFAVATKIIKT